MMYKGGLDCFKATLAEEGVRGLYRGFGVVTIVGSPAACLYLTSYEALKKLLGADDSAAAFLKHFFAGLGAEAVSCLLFVPVDVIKERLQVQRRAVPGERVAAAAPGRATSVPPTYAGSLDAVRTIARTEGLLGLYKGYYATLASFGPFSALYFLFYEEARGALAAATRAASKRELSWQATLAASAAAGTAASVITSPLDLAKLRLQTQRRLAAGEPVPQGHLLGLRGAFQAVYREGGARALFRGAGTRAAFHTPSTCITFTCFEECKKLVAAVL